MSVNASSLTCYALLAAIENDLRDLITSVSQETEAETVLGTDLLQRAIERRQKERRTSTSQHLSAVLPFIDFSDAYSVLRRVSDRLQPDLAQGLAELSQDWETIVPIRNRVAHSRPLEIDDLPRLVDFSHEVVTLPSFDWRLTRRTHAELSRNPGHVLGLTLDLVRDDARQMRHNLPPADFDETGFLGRKDQRRELVKALKGPWPVISILGDGGLGKTALALQVAYDLMDDPENQFEAVVWTTAKNATLTATEIVRIEGAIQDSLGLFGGAAVELGGEVALEDPVREVLEYLKAFKILLVLDNLETVIDDRVRDFLRNLPHHSKVLITSRIGVGTENPFKLAPLSSPEARHLLRSLGRVRGVQSLTGLNDKEAEELVDRMKCHPAYIKWFVSGVQSGQSADKLVADGGLLLDYCMSNVFDYLEDDAKAVLRSMLVLPGTHTLAELAYLNDFAAARIQQAVLELTTTNFLSQVRGGGGGTGYALSDFAKAYLQKTLSLSLEERNWLLARHQELYQLGGDLQAAHSQDPFAPETIDIRSAGDFSAARCLLLAVEHAKVNEYDLAMGLCREAAELAPGYHEPSRVEAFIHQISFNYGEAYDAYDRARDLAPSSAFVRFFFGNFLVDSGFNARQGLQELQYASRLEPDSPAIRLAVARAHLQLGDVPSSIEVASTLVRGTNQESPWSQDALGIALKAAQVGGAAAVRSSAWEDLAATTEVVATTVERAAVEDFNTHLLDFCMLLENWCAKASERASDDYIARTCDRLAARLRETRRRADVGHLDRRIGSICNIVADKGYAFLDSDQGRYFMHASALWDRTYFDSLTIGSTLGFGVGAQGQGTHLPAQEAYWIA